jgi:hypothetical protein
MRTSLHSLIPFLPFLLSHIQLPIPSILCCNSQLRRLSVLIPALPSSYPGRLASRNSINSNDLLCTFYIHWARTTQKTQPLYCWEGVFTAPLHSNGSYSIVACIFRCCGNVFIEQLPSNGCLLWFHYFGFRESCHNICVFSVRSTAENSRFCSWYRGLFLRV